MSYPEQDLGDFGPAVIPEVADVMGRVLSARQGRTAKENLVEVFTYIVSFGSFYVFVWFAKRMLMSPGYRRDSSVLSRLVFKCVGDRDDADEPVTHEKKKAESVSDSSFYVSAARLAVCILGIQVSYLLWGLMQERIMTKPYETGELFSSSKFLVFANRFLAFFVAWAAVRIGSMQPDAVPEKHTPLYQFSYSSVSNILSSVCQYEALKYVSFPTQVLAKSCKMVPVMLMGYVVNKKTYSVSEYVVAVLVTTGAALFKLNEKNDAPVQNTEFVGILLIVGYMGTDSFTSNWQSKVFKQYGVGSTEMMMYANAFSSGFTALGLLVTMEILSVGAYLIANPSICVHMLIMAICSGIGQLFIFYTIKEYGPLVFATIQTVRQFLSVVLSIVFFAHPINAMEALGIAIVFLALGGQIGQKWINRKSKAKSDTRSEEQAPLATAEAADPECGNRSDKEGDTQSLLKR
jgi:adenosine 3'-phospho 5'-phosphosulfate transporter B2